MVLPDLDGAAQRILHQIIGQRQVVQAEDADQGREHSPRFAANPSLRRSSHRLWRGHSEPDYTFLNFSRQPQTARPSNARGHIG